MSNPTLTWTLSAAGAFAGAGANMTVAETLALIKAKIDTEHAAGGLWMVSDYNAGNGTLEVKRDPATASGADAELLAARILFFGGSSPNAAALAQSVTASATAVYCGMALNAGTTGPDASYTTGAPYASATWLPAAIVATVGTPTAVSAGELILFYADDVFGVLGYHGSDCWFSYAGRIVVRAKDDALVWAHAETGTTAVSSGTDGNGASGSIAWMAPVFGTTYQPRMVGWNGATVRTIGRFQYNAVAGDCFASSEATALQPIPVCDGINGSSPTPSFLGYLRQMRFGPKAGNKSYLRDVNGGLQARMIGAGDGGTQVFGLWLDYVQ